MVSLSIYIFLMYISNFVLGYHFYNPSNQIIFKSSSRTLPSGYIRLRPARHLRHTRHPSTKRRPNGSCTEPGFVCNEPYNRTYTAIFECKNDNQCPLYYKCCEQKCFQHKICVESSYRKAEITDGVCEKWPYDCAYAYPYFFSKSFMCLRDSQCPKNYKCCSQNCFLHKICSKVVKTTISENKQNQVRNEPDDVTTSNASTSGETEVEKTEDTNFMEDVEIITEKESKQEEANLENTGNTEHVGEDSERKQQEDEEEANPVVQIKKDETEISELSTTTETATEFYETTTAAVTEVVTTKTTEAIPENFDITDKVTVVVVVTPDPNAIDSILPQNTVIASKNDDDESSTRNPEYQEYYEEYDEDEDEDNNNENKK